MDDLDKKILMLLEQNARMPVKDIARQVALTSPAVSSRIRRLEEQGVIAGYTALLRDPQRQTSVDALISVSIAPADRDEFLTLARADAQVRQCFHVTGSHSFIVKVSCEGMPQLEQLKDRNIVKRKIARQKQIQLLEQKKRTLQ